MEFAKLIKIVGDEPIFEAGLLLAGDVNKNDVHRQLSRWTKAGKLYKLRRGVYTLAPPFQKVKAHPFLVANCMVRASYVSCQSAMAYYGIIPEHVEVTISVTTMRPARWKTPLGTYEYHHVKTDFLHGYKLTELGMGQSAFVATPEKALLDFIYLQPGSDSLDYLKELRLQNLDRLSLSKLNRWAQITNRQKLLRATTLILQLAETEAKDYAKL